MEKTSTIEVAISRLIDKGWRPFAVGVAVCIGLYGGYVAYSFVKSNQEKKAQEQLFTLQKELNQKQEELLKANQADQNEDKIGDKKNDKKNKDKSKESPAVVKNPETFKTHFSSLSDQFTQFIKQQSGHKAALIAAVDIAGLAYEYKNFELSVEVLNSVVNTLSDKDVFSGLIRTQLGSSLMELKKYPEAKAQFQKIIDAEGLKSFHPQALLLNGVCALETGDFDGAQFSFSRLEQDFPLTGAANSAKDFKKLIALKKGT